MEDRVYFLYILSDWYLIQVEVDFDWLDKLAEELLFYY